MIGPAACLHNPFVLRRIPACALVCAAGMAVSLWGSPAIAQTPPRQLPTFARSIEPGSITGREFSGLRIAAARQLGDVVITADRAWTWAEAGNAGEVGLDGLPVATQRLFLQGDVQIDIGGYHFTAVRAVVWMQAIGASASRPDDPDFRVRQFAIAFDRVSDPGAQAGFAQAADRLLVTAALDGAVKLRCESVSPERPDAPPQGVFLKEGEAMLAAQLRRQLDPSLPETPLPPPRVPDLRQSLLTPGQSRPFEPNAGFAQRGPTAADLAPTNPTDPLFAKDGVITFAVGTSLPTGATAPQFDEAAGETETVKLIRGEEDNVVLLSGGVALQYKDLRKYRNLQITAERAVVFLEPGPLTQLAQFGADQVKGVYLEGDVVATDGQYTLRGPKVYYDFAQNKAIMVDAVFTTFDTRMNLPIYVRAKSLRQEAASEFSVEGARLSTSSFFTPMFSVGASKISIKQQTVDATPSAPSGKATYLDARGVTLRLGDVPFFWLPNYSGEIAEIPLTDIRVESSSGSGAALKTTWDVFGLLGERKPDGLDIKLLLDGYFDRGAAIGTKVRWQRDDHDGQLFAWGLIHDEGRDVLSTGARIDANNDFRGVLFGEDTWKLDDNWTLQLELANQSDPRVVDAFYRDVAREGRELASSAYLRYLDNNQMFTALVKGNLNNYVPNQYILQSLGYTVDKLPEVSYKRLADDVAKGVAPGFLTWSHEYTFSRVRFDFVDPKVRDYGLDTFGRAMAFAGITPDQSLADELKAAGLDDTDVMRFDTRQELNLVLDANPFKITPFVVGRFTGYDKEISKFFANSPEGDQKYRYFYAAGSRFSTEFVRVDDGVENTIFDLHRTRHIIEPNVTVWTGASNITQDNLPVFDDTVESINTGSTVRAGVNQVWQTKRGGPGRWHNVDVFKLSTDVVFSTSDADKESTIGRFFDYRPEYSFLGNYLTADAAWQVTDSIALSANSIYDLDLHQQARTTIGGMIQHWPEFSTFAQVRYVNALDATYVDLGVTYKLTRRYDFSAYATYDTDRTELQEISGTLRRKWPEATIGVKASYDNIRDETSIGVVFEPQAVANRGGFERVQRLRDIGR